MAEIEVISDADITNFYLVEGLPGTGIVAKIAADYLVNSLDMEVYAEIHSRETDRVTVFEKDNPQLNPPTRIFYDEETGIAVLKSDAPIPSAAEEFFDQLTEFIQEEELRPVLLTGLPRDVKEGEHGFFKVMNGSLGEGLELDTPPIDGGIGGPTGALLADILKKDIDAVGLVIESDPRFPDPQASRIVIEKGIEPLTGIDLDTQQLKESADQIKKKKKQLAEELQQQQDKSSEAYPREMYK